MIAYHYYKGKISEFSICKSEMSNKSRDLLQRWPTENNKLPSLFEIDTL